MTMARKKAKLCWDDVADVCSRALTQWDAFRPNVCETIEIEGEGIEEWPTFIMDDAGRSFTLIWTWHGKDEDLTTVRCRVELTTIRRPYGLETVFRCPDCWRKCTRLALRSFGLQCAKCGPIVWGSHREGKVGRLVRRANLVTSKLGLQTWAQQPMAKPRHMRMRTYLSLLDQRQRVLGTIARHLVVRRRLRGDNTLHMGNLLHATAPDRYSDN
jgi:hypothetical protein